MVRIGNAIRRSIGHAILWFLKPILDERSRAETVRAEARTAARRERWERADERQRQYMAQRLSDAYGRPQINLGAWGASSPQAGPWTPHHPE
jgi:hypothetical protein